MRVLDEWLLTPWRVAVHQPSMTAVVADLHLGYDRVRRRNGEAVPVRTVRDELAPLLAAMHQTKTRRLVVAGDLFEDARVDRAELIDDLALWLKVAGVELVAVVPGNHDRGLGDGDALPLEKDGVELGRWLVVHGDREGPQRPTVQGHEHPWFRWRGRLSGPCYLVGPTRLVLPAYSRDAAGANVVGKERWADYRCCVIAGGEVLDFGELRRLG